LGQAINKEVGRGAGISRYGDLILPMDDTLIMAAIDLGGRSYYDSDLVYNRQQVGAFPVELVDEFFRSLTNNGRFNLHYKMLKGGNTHHLIEACFKSFGRVLDKALVSEDRLANNPLSTKGQLQEGGRH
jgi:imidazoleglycerol-phosphate dehydratase